jgi:hypothetical protein
VNYFRIQVALAHMGSCHTEYTCWHIATSASAADVMCNQGKLLPGVRRVTEVHAVTEADYNAARHWGQPAFAVKPR